MNRTLTTTLTTAVLLGVLVACNPTTTSTSSTSNDGASTTITVKASSATTASSDTPPVPEQLRDLDIAAGGNAQPQAAYNSAFSTLSSRCKEQGVGLGNEVGAVLKLLQQHNINDETQLSVMQHLAASIPAGSPKMSCADIGGAYVTLREGQ